MKNSMKIVYRMDNLTDEFDREILGKSSRQVSIAGFSDRFLLILLEFHSNEDSYVDSKVKFR